MKKLKKLLCIIMMLVLTFSIECSAMDSEFHDEPESDIIKQIAGGSVKLHFDSRGGTKCESISIGVGVAPTVEYKLPKPTKIGYTFVGWFTKSGYKVNSTQGSLSKAFDKMYSGEEGIVYAKWTTNKNIVKATDVMTIVNDTINKSENITAKAYVGNISKDNYLGTIAINSKTNTFYMDSYELCGVRMYMKGRNTFVYNPATGRWNKNKGEFNRWKLNLEIETNDSIKLLKERKFMKKECYALKVYNGETSSIYYVNKSKKEFIGITTQNGSRKVTILIDTNDKVIMPTAVAKGKKTNDIPKTNKEISVRDFKCDKSGISDIKITSVKELNDVISTLEKSNTNKYQTTTIVNFLKTYDSKYFKKKALFIKNYSYGGLSGVYAIQKNVSKGKMNIVLTEWYSKGIDYIPNNQSRIIVIEANKNAVKNVSQIKLSVDKTLYKVPSAKS